MTILDVVLWIVFVVPLFAIIIAAGIASTNYIIETIQDFRYRKETEKYRVRMRARMRQARIEAKEREAFAPYEDE